MGGSLNVLLLYCHRDQLFVSRQPAPPSAPVTLWQNVTIASRQLQHPDMEYHPYAPPTHTITSPPTTPMTPGPLTPHHVGVFPMCRSDHHISTHHGSGMTSYPKYVCSSNTIHTCMYIILHVYKLMVITVNMYVSIVKKCSLTIC